MGDLRVTIEHGSGLGGLLNGKTALVVAAVVVIGASGGLGGVESGLNNLLYWAAGVMLVLVAAGGWLIYRATRHAKGTAYIRSVHGPTQHEIVLNENRAMRRQLDDIRAMRRQMAAAEALGLTYHPPVIHAEVIERG